MHSISCLPNELLQLLPQWLDWPTLLSMPLVCKRWKRLFVLPPMLNVYLEYWHDCYGREAMVATVVVGHCDKLLLPSKRLLYQARSLTLGRDWRDSYHSTWISLPTREVMLRYRKVAYWTIKYGYCEPYSNYGERVLSSKKDKIGKQSIYLIMSCEDLYDPDATVSVQYRLGDMGTAPSSPILPAVREIDDAFISYLICDVSYELIDRYPQCLACNDRGEWSRFLYQDIIYNSHQPLIGRWLECIIPGSEGVSNKGFYIMLDLNVPRAFWDVGMCPWDSKHCVHMLLQRMVAYVLRRLDSEGIPYSLQA